MSLHSSVIHVSMLVPFLAAVLATSGCSHDNPGPTNTGDATSNEPVSPVAEGPSSATAAPIATAAPVEGRIVVLGRATTKEFYEGTDETLWNRLTPDMRKAIGTAGDLNALRKQIATE